MKFKIYDKIRKILISEYFSIAFKDNWIFLDVEYKPNNFREFNLHSDDVEVLKPIMLKDDNDVEIYDGDIVKVEICDEKSISFAIMNGSIKVVGNKFENENLLKTKMG